jgi:hypothetical protein
MPDDGKYKEALALLIEQLARKTAEVSSLNLTYN